MSSLVLASGNRGNLQLVTLDAFNGAPFLDYENAGPGTWLGYGLLPSESAVTGTAVAAATGTDGNLQVVVLDKASGQPQLFWQDKTSGNWSGLPLPGTELPYNPGFSGVAAGSAQGGSLQVVLLTADTRQPYVSTQNVMGQWIGPMPLLATQPSNAAGFDSILAAVGNQGNLQILLLAADTRQPYLYWQDAAKGNWHGPSPLTPPGVTPHGAGFAAMAAGVAQGRLTVVMLGQDDGQPYLYSQDPQSGSWMGPSALLLKPFSSGFSTVTLVQAADGTLQTILVSKADGQAYVTSLPGSNPLQSMLPDRTLPPISEVVALPGAQSSVQVVLREAGSNCLRLVVRNSVGAWLYCGRLSSRTWMQDMAWVIGSRRLCDLAIPGTHDSATSAITAHSPISPDAPPALLALDKPLGFVTGSLIANWAVAQSMTIAQQLNAGIRYLDLRVSKNGEEFWTMHSLFSEPLSDVLTAVATFLEENQGEIVILDFNQFGTTFGGTFELMNEADFTRLSDSVMSALKPVFSTLTGLKPLDMVSTFLKSGARAIVIWRSLPPSIVPPAAFWSGNTILGLWPNRTTVPEMIDEIGANLYRRIPTSLFVVQGILTPGGDQITGGIFGSVAPGNLRNYSRPAWPALKDQLPNWFGKFSIVIIDHIEDAPDFVETIINYNLLPPPKVTVSDA